MDKKIIFRLTGNALLGFGIMFAAPAIYGLLRDGRLGIIFAATGIVTLALGALLNHSGRRHKRRLLLVESAFSALIIYPVLALFGAIPFWLTGWLSPAEAILETVGNLTSAGLSLLPKTAPFVLRIWQSLLMWFGSLIFLVMLVTILPEVSGCFGMNLSLRGRQSFSSVEGQMNVMARRILKVYVLLTAVSVGFFKLAGLGDLDSVLMALRCISTGGGDYFPSRSNTQVEYAAAFSMLLACGNFLFYYRMLSKIPPPITAQQENILRRGINYLKTLGKNLVGNVRDFYLNSEVKAAGLIIISGVVFITFSTYQHGMIQDGNEAFRSAFFHVISFLSTTGMSLPMFERSHDFDRFLVFLMAIFGGCIGSATGGLKIVRLLVLLKITAAELTRVMHPRMVISIRVNRISVPREIMGRVLGFFFLACLTLFVSSAVLSFMDLKFSEAVAMSVACLTNVGALPGICEAGNFLSLPVAGKIFCMGILIIGRLEIFALLITAAGLATRRNFKEW